jgi:uncharacterized protein (UPF0276 family)
VPLFDSVDRLFECRARQIPKLGLGLSVDVYSPDLFELMDHFNSKDHQPAYLEIFRANRTAIKSVRQQMSALPLTYHGEGLWITQPDFPVLPFLREELDDVTSQLAILRSPWLNHECATKQMAGYSFGTYLPPLYTPESARVVADNITLVQKKLDGLRPSEGLFGPLFLLEMSPLTYFMAGTISVPEYFRLVTQLIPCGLVLDVGHLWTVYRYTAASQHLSVVEFVEEFLDEFPLERVIEIHIAGLSVHEAALQYSERIQPEWIDAHAAPIQSVCWTMLEQVLSHPRLTNLRGVALEVDTKPIDEIIEEFRQVSLRFIPIIRRRLSHNSVSTVSIAEPAERLRRESGSDVDRPALQADYARYARIATGQQQPTGPEWQEVAKDLAGLTRYIHDYLPYEILHWGGALIEMFPRTYRAMHDEGMSINDFLPWWFQRSRPIDRPYDFFLLKIDRMLDFVAERVPKLLQLAEQEATMLRTAYAEANEPVRPVMEPAQ